MLDADSYDDSLNLNRILLGVYAAIWLPIFCMFVHRKREFPIRQVSIGAPS